VAGAPDASSTETTAEVPEIRGFGPARNTPLILLAVVATIFVLDWAQPVLIPIVLGLLLSYALAPLVDRLERLAIPRAVSAAALLLGIVVGIGATAVSLQDEAVNLIETLPEAVDKIRGAVRAELRDEETTLEKVQKAADELEEAAAEATAGEAPPGVTRVQIEQPRLNIREYLWTTVSGAVYGIGVASGLAFWAIGLENAAVWGVLAGVLNLVPYLGAILTIGGTALVAFFQFGTLGMALGVAAISLAINGLEGWLWGAWGLLLGLPIMMVIKAICDHVEDFKPIGEFMGE
jgi:predicted PurR-regulated permease PerM